MKQAYDVVIVGGGGSGLAAAASAAENGAEVLLLEKRPELGGSTGIAVGSYTSNRTRLQRQAGIEDSLEAHAQDAGRFPPDAYEARNNDELRRFFLDHSAETLDWLTGMGLYFQGPNPEPPNRVPRMHNVIPGAKAYIAALQLHLLKYGGEIITRASVVELVREDGKVCGVVADTPNGRQAYRARKGVVLAAGDYANAPELIGRFKGSEFTVVEGINPYSTGDGHVLAERAGASLVNMDITYGPEVRFIPPPRPTFQQLLPVSGWFVRLAGWLVPRLPEKILHRMIQRLLVTWQHPEDALYGDGAILVNQEGRRFCDETQSPSREIAIARQPGKVCYILLDEHLIEKYSSWPHFISTAPKIAYAYVEDYLKLRPDVAVAGPNLAAVSKARGIPVAALRETVNEINRTRLPVDRRQLAGSRWVLLGPAKAYFTTTEGGAAISRHFEVLDEAGRPIPGLYAVGQNGLGGQVLWGHGLHIAWAITSGRMVGRQLAEGGSE